MYDGKDKWYSLILELCIHTASDFYQYLWRITDGYCYKYIDQILTRQYRLLINGENEWACKMKKFEAFDGTIGGYHGGERIDIDTTNCFALFFADGKCLSIDANTEDFVLECKEFRYIQKASLHIVTDKQAGTVVSGHPIYGYHIKDNLFAELGFELENTVDIIDDVTIPYESIVSTAFYSSLVCICKDVAEKAIIPDGIKIESFPGGDVQFASDNTLAHKITYWNNSNNVCANVSGFVKQGLTEDDITDLYVRDRLTDAKYYRVVKSEKDLTAIKKIRTQTVVKFINP